MLYRILKVNLWTTCLDSKTLCILPHCVLRVSYDSQVSRDYFPKSINALVFIIQKQCSFCKLIFNQNLLRNIWLARKMFASNLGVEYWHDFGQIL
jgi:hypothetical protein